MDISINIYQTVIALLTSKQAITSYEQATFDYDLSLKKSEAEEWGTALMTMVGEAVKRNPNVKTLEEFKEADRDAYVELVSLKNKHDSLVKEYLDLVPENYEEISLEQATFNLKNAESHLKSTKNDVRNEAIDRAIGQKHVKQIENNLEFIEVVGISIENFDSWKNSLEY